MLKQLEKLIQQWGDTKSYSPSLANLLGGVTAAIFLNYLLDQGEKSLTPYWFSVHPKTLQKNTGLSLTEQTSARDILRRRGFLQEQWRDGGFLAFQVNLGELIQKIETLQQMIPPSPAAASVPSMPEVHTENSLTVSGPATDPYFFARRPSGVVPVSPHYQFAGPWRSQTEFEAFQRALLDYFKQKGVENPSGYVFRTIDAITKGMISPFWEEFQANQPLGSSQRIQREWEVSPGIPYPAFEEERIQYYLNKREPIEMAVAKARQELRNPQLAQDLWEGFLRKCDRLADEAIKAQSLGVKTPYLPASFSDKKSVNKEQVIAKLNKIQAQLMIKEAETPAQEIPPPVIVPSLESLQKAYNNPLGKKIVEQQIAQHPEWGYGIKDDKIVDKFPF